MEYFPKEFGNEFLFNKYQAPESNETIEVYARNKYHREKQVSEFKLSYRINDKEINSETLEMRMYFPQELDGYLKFNGFLIEEKYGGYDLKKFDSSSSKQIIVSKLAMPIDKL